MTADGARVDLSELEARLGHVFVQPALAAMALTHMSGVAGDQSREGSYQRLEFLGDRVLGMSVAAMLYAEFPKADEGELSRRLADLVRKETCAEVAVEWDLGCHVRLGPSEAQSGSRGRPAILADVCEALIGAVFVDAGYVEAAALVARAWADRMRAPRRPLRDRKTALQEWAQAKGRPPPSYQQVDRSGPDHAPRFVISVSVVGYPSAEGVGTSKRAAEQAAAEAFTVREGFGAVPSRGPGRRAR